MRKIVPYELNVPVGTSSVQARVDGDYSILQEIGPELRAVIRLTNFSREDP
jgi:hypothetical protein